MSEQLTPLEALKHLQLLATPNDDYKGDDNCYEIIETALNDYIVYKQDYERVMKEKNSLLKEYAKSQKERKALEIIRIKEIDTALFKECPDIEEYNYWCLDKAVLTQNEYDLLKEVLK